MHHTENKHPKKKPPEEAKSERKEEKRNGMAAWPAPTAIRARSTTTQIRHRDRPQLFNATRPPSLASQTQPTPAHHHRTQTPRQRRRSTEKTRGEGNAAESDTDGLAPRGLPPDPRTSRRPPPLPPSGRGRVVGITASVAAPRRGPPAAQVEPKGTIASAVATSPAPHGGRGALPSAGGSPSDLLFLAGGGRPCRL